jgi:uncharacterized protein YwbE
MNNLDRVLQILQEQSPPWYDENDFTEPLPFTLSANQYSGYKVLVEYPHKLQLIQRYDNLAFVLGVLQDDGTFNQHILTRTTLPRVGSPKNLKKALQVDLVLASDIIKNGGLAKSVYKEIISRYTLISDFEQHGKAKNLWKAISNMKDIFVYVYDGSTKDYIREDGKIKRYIGESIPDEEIWGKDLKHMSRVLVASTTEIE